MPQVSSKACCAATGAGIGDREARYGVRFGLSDPGGSVAAGRASHSGVTCMNLVVRLAALIDPTVGGILKGSGRVSEYCGRLQFRCLKHELQIKHDV